MLSPRDRALKKIQEAKEKQLEELDLSNASNASDEDKLTEIPEEIFELKYLKQLKLGWNKISSLPESMGKLASLEKLLLYENQLTSLPKSIGKLTSLKELNLDKNQFKSLPESIGNLTELNKLFLYGNQLTSLPEFIGNFTSLHELSLHENQLTRLPESFGNLTSLSELFLYRNQLIGLPESFGNLTNLSMLALQENQLTSLPESFGNLTNLSKLSLKENQLTSLPESFGSLTSLSKLDINKNPLAEPPLEVIKQGIQKIKEYFEQLKKEGEDYIYEAKLIIVGEGGAGKTTLTNKIRNPSYQLLENEPSTEGIEVIKWKFPCLDDKGKEREFTVNIWDFGGQEIYHATHQFFLTKRSLYSLVADTRKEDTNFYYWLNIVELLSDNSPLLIIKNEKQDRKREINERALRAQFTNLEKTLATNLATNRGLEEVIENIKLYIQNLSHIGQTLPKTWVKVRQALESDPRNYISLQEYLDICESNGFDELNYKLQISGYLHDLGVCLHFQDEEDSLLYKIVILKPQWGTDAVYKVLDNPQVRDNKGHFTRNDLKIIWHEEIYSTMRGELLELMKKFQLCYEVPESQDTFIAPQLLSQNQPEYQWDKISNLILRYSYPNFMPKGIVSRFIVIMHQYIENQEYVWKSGVILSKNKTRAEVIEKYGKREIKIRVVGNNRRNFLTIISHEIDKINDSYKQLNYKKLIPCNCDTCKNDQNPYAYNFNELLERVSKRKLTIECRNEPYHEVQVLSLIDNVIEIEQLANKTEQVEFYRQNNHELLEIIKLQANNPINININDRIINVLKGNYNENIQGNYFEEAATEIQKLLDQLQQSNSVSLEKAQQQTAKELANKAQSDPTLKERLIKLGKFVSENSEKNIISEGVKGVIKLVLFML